MIGEAHQPSVRAQIITRRTYNRPVNDEGTRFERWSDTMDRVIGHQRSLWEDAQGGSLRPNQEAELAELRELGMQRKSLVAGRTLWLGGTEVVKRRQSANFNCSFTEVRTVHDLVDIFWLLLQGCGTGFKPIGGTLSGFTRRMEVKVVRSTRTAKDGDENNRESYNPDTREWTIRIGDSAEAWAKSIGKIAAGKYPAKTIVIDLSQIRPGGSRLRGYGWICSGDRALSVALAAICEIMNRRAGKLLSKSDIWDIVNWLGTVLSSRRSAQIGLVEYGDSEWRDIAERKPKGFDSGPEWFKSQSNNSIVFQDKPNNRQIRDIFDMMIANGGAEPGFVNAAAAKRRAPWFAGLNPCLTRDTQVYTADGRRGVTIGQLADDEVDVPVFCVDHDNNLAIRMMRHPRRTGIGIKILKVTLDNGQSIRVTETHKFRLKSGEYRQARGLAPGDSFALLTQYIPTYCDGDSLADRYVTMGYQKNQSPSEHRMIGEFFAGRPLLDSEDIHHANHDRLDNYPDNLQVIGSSDHQSWHMTGESNHKYCGVSNPQLLAKGCELTRNLGRRFSTVEWNRFAELEGFPMCFSLWRKQSLGTIGAFSQRCAELEGIEAHSGVDPRLVKTLRTMVDAGLEAEIVGNEVLVRKECEHCGKEFSVDHLRREQGMCSHTCGNLSRKMDKAKWKSALVSAHEDRKVCRRSEQVRVYRELTSKVGRAPEKKEWVSACKAIGVSPEISRTSSPFRKYSDLREAAGRENHKVVSVVEDGVEDVYNGTVDDYHNFFVGGWGEGATDEGRERIAWINNLQCGEILLGAFCNLSETDIAKFKNDHVGLHRALRVISRANYRQTVVNLNDGILQSHWHQQNEYLRLCGVGLCGIANRPDFTHYDFRQARYSAIAGAYSMADELGLERPKNVTCIKPGGTIPKCLDTTEGATKPLGRYILNNVSFSRHDPSVSMLVDAGYRVFNNPNDDDSIIATLPVAYHGVDFGGGDLNKETAIEQLERYRMLQDAYVDQNTSITISYDPSEVKDMVKWFDRNWDSYVGVSFLFRNDPTKTAEDLGFSYMPQTVVTREAYEQYVSGLRPIDLESSEGIVSEIEDDCATGACPVR